MSGKHGEASSYFVVGDARGKGSERAWEHAQESSVKWFSLGTGQELLARLEAV